MLSAEQSTHGKRAEVPPAMIDHTYIDYSAVDVAKLLEEESDDTNVPVQAYVIGTLISTNRLTLPMRLHMILSDPKNCKIVRWMPHGRSWKVFDEEGMVKLCREYFNVETYDGFIKLVNMWGFKKLVGSGPDYKSYYHQCFLRGKLDLCRLMDTTINTGKFIPVVPNEPNFYVISKFCPLPKDPEQVLCSNCRLSHVPTHVPSSQHSEETEDDNDSINDSMESNPNTREDDQEQEWGENEEANGTANTSASAAALYRYFSYSPLSIQWMG